MFSDVIAFTECNNVTDAKLINWIKTCWCWFTMCSIRRQVVFDVNGVRFLKFGRMSLKIWARLCPNTHCWELWFYYRASICEGGLGSRNSVRLSVTRVDCDKTKWHTADILIPHESAITLLLCHQQWLVGDAPFPLKSMLKVTHPFEECQLRPTLAYNNSTIRDSEKSSIMP